MRILMNRGKLFDIARFESTFPTERERFDGLTERTVMGSRRVLRPTADTLIKAAGNPCKELLNCSKQLIKDKPDHDLKNCASAEILKNSTESIWKKAGRARGQLNIW